MSFDLTNQNISDTFQNLLQKTGSEGHLYDLVGNKVRNLTIDGTLTANSYIVSESVTTVTSGSTTFGNSADDTHAFTGSLAISSSGGEINLTGLGGTGDDHPQIYIDKHGSFGSGVKAFTIRSSGSGGFTEQLTFIPDLTNAGLWNNSGVYAGSRAVSNQGYMLMSERRIQLKFGVWGGAYNTVVDYNMSSTPISGNGTSTVGVITSNLWGADIDHLFKGEGDDNLLYLEAEYDKVGIGKKPFSDDAKLTVEGDISASGDLQVNGTNYAGWNGSHTRIKILPTDFMANSSTGRPPYVDSGSLNELAARAHGDQSLYATYAIPQKYTASAVMIYGNDVNNAVSCSEGFINTPTFVSNSVGVVGTEFPLHHPISSSDTNFVWIKVHTDGGGTGGGDDYIYGGYITITRNL